MLAALFEAEWATLRAFIPPEDFQHRLELGKQHLLAYAKQHVKKWVTEVRIELTLRQIELDGVPIQGKIDKVEYLDAATVRLVDYKTGKPDSKNGRAPLIGNRWAVCIGGKWHFTSCYSRLRGRATMW
ncbi:MAG: PD-(D/E)XK nuclease family protein [Saprospirales bacterium]|nr:PD-(D/E)XK nuclease family protein [Saprospirales bacterium]